MSQEAIDAAQAAAVALVRTNRRNRKNYDMLMEMIHHCLSYGVSLPPHIAEWHAGQKLVQSSPDLEAIARQNERVEHLKKVYGLG
jgi:hypothetical protein